MRRGKNPRPWGNHFPRVVEGPLPLIGLQKKKAASGSDQGRGGSAIVLWRRVRPELSLGSDGWGAKLFGSKRRESSGISSAPRRSSAWASLPLGRDLIRTGCAREHEFDREAWYADH